jgi:hypothetical protein
LIEPLGNENENKIAKRSLIYIKEFNDCQVEKLRYASNKIMAHVSFK